MNLQYKIIHKKLVACYRLLSIKTRSQRISLKPLIRATIFVLAKISKNSRTCYFWTQLTTHIQYNFVDLCANINHTLNKIYQIILLIHWSNSVSSVKTYEVKITIAQYAIENQACNGHLLNRKNQSSLVMKKTSQIPFIFIFYQVLNLLSRLMLALASPSRIKLKSKT